MSVKTTLCALVASFALLPNTHAKTPQNPELTLEVSDSNRSHQTKLEKKLTKIFDYVINHYKAIDLKPDLYGDMGIASYTLCLEDGTEIYVSVPTKNKEEYRDPRSGLLSFLGYIRISIDHADGRRYSGLLTGPEISQNVYTFVDAHGFSFRGNLGFYEDSDDSTLGIHSLSGSLERLPMAIQIVGDLASDVMRMIK